MRKLIYVLALCASACGAGATDDSIPAQARAPGQAATNAAARAGASGSISGTLLTTTSGGQIVDADGRVWTLDASGTVYADQLEDGASHDAILLLYFSGRLYQENTSGEWCVHTANGWDRAADPRVPSDNGANIPATTVQLVDAALHVWCLIEGNVYRDGVRDPASSNPLLLLDYYGIIFQETAAQVWSSWNGVDWVAARYDPRSIASKPIDSYVDCSGNTDSAAGVAKAFADAAQDAFTLIVDCPVTIHVGMDIAKPIFIDDKTSVVFIGSGRFTLDNFFVPSFVIANSTYVTLLNWNVEYVGSEPVNWDTGGYYDNGAFVSETGSWQPASAFLVKTLTPWLKTNRQMQYGFQASPNWAGGGNSSALFYFDGDVSNVIISGMNAHVPEDATGDHYIPMVFSFLRDYVSGQSVTTDTLTETPYVEIPHDLTFSNITLDGIYMGWQGNLRDTTINGVVGLRYCDLQDANGENVGGIGDDGVHNKWFAPPHLFYLDYTPASKGGDASLFNRNLTVTNVVDQGLRTGKARDTGLPGDLASGNALSLKIGGENVRVDHYVSHRPDGFLDALTADGMTLSNVTATYNSQFINNIYPGIRFPLGPYANTTFDDVVLTDEATLTTQAPVRSVSTCQSCVFQDVTVQLQKWSGDLADLPATITPPSGTTNGNEGVIEYGIASPAQIIHKAQNGALTFTLVATPSIVKSGQATTLTWSSQGTGTVTCEASGAWTGALAGAGTQTVRLTSGGQSNVTLRCTDSTGSTETTVPIEVQP